MFGRLAIAIFLSVLLAASSCSREGGEESKQRVLEKKDTGEERAKSAVALTDIDLAGIPGDIGELEKIILMPQEEVAARLGSYRFDAQLAFTVSRAGKDVTLTEHQSLKQAANGDFHLTIGNDKNKGFELRWIDGATYDQLSGNSFRKSRPDGRQTYWRESASGSLKRYYQYFRGYIKFHAASPATYEGRRALKVEFSLDPNGKTPGEDLPFKNRFSNKFAVSALASNKLINKTRRKISRCEDVEGHLIVDEETAVILSYKARGIYVIPMSDKQFQRLLAQGAENPGRDVNFVMDISLEVKDIGRDISIETPKHEKPIKRTRPPEDPGTLLPEGILVPPETTQQENK